MKKTGIIVVIVLIVVCGGGGYAFMQFRKAQAEAMKAKNNDFITVAKGNLVVQVVENGTVDAVKSVEVKSQVSGRLAKLFVDEGDPVTQGQLIAVIDQRESKLRVEQDSAQVRGAQAALSRADVDVRQRRVTAEASLRQAEIRLKQLEDEMHVQPTLTYAAIRSAETAYNTALQAKRQLIESTHPNELTALQSQVDEAEANLRNVNAEEARRKELLAKGYLSQREYESSILQLDLAKTRLRSAREQFGRVKEKQQNDVEQADERVKQTRAELDRAKANSIQDATKRRDYENAVAALRQAKAGLLDIQQLQASRRQSAAQVDQLKSALGEAMRLFGETEIRAPMTGVVGKKSVEVGEQVSSISGFSNGSAILRIEDRNSLRVKLEINEIDVAKIAVGMPASIEVDAFPGEKFSGKVQKIAPTATTAGTNVAAGTVVKYAVEVYLANPDKRLKSGMSAKVTIVPLERKDVIVIPVDYVGKDDKGRFVMLAPAKPGGEPTRVNVEVGAASGANIEIRSGVSVGAKLTKPEYKGPARKGMMQAGPDE